MTVIVTVIVIVSRSPRRGKHTGAWQFRNSKPTKHCIRHEITHPPERVLKLLSTPHRKKGASPEEAASVGRIIIIPLWINRATKIEPKGVDLASYGVYGKPRQAPGHAGSSSFFALMFSCELPFFVCVRCRKCRESVTFGRGFCW